VQRCEGAGCTNFAQVGTSATTTYNDNGLATGNSYSYRVQASDTAGGLSPFSNVASATPVRDGTQRLTATAASMVQINLSWTASTSSVGLANYIVQRCQGAGCTNFARKWRHSGDHHDIQRHGFDGWQPAIATRSRASDHRRGREPFSNAGYASTLSSATAITYVQGAYARPNRPRPASASHSRPRRAAGDLNVVVVGWNNSTATVSSVTDTSHNTYTLAVARRSKAESPSQSI